MARPDVLSSGQGASTLLLLLPGALMTPQHMVEAGMFEALRQRSLDLDLMAVNLHALGGAHDDALRILAEALVLPARASYQKVWLAGISRGGQLALSCLAEQTTALDGVCLLAPYPGSRLTINAIERAGGLNAWTPSEDQLEDPEFRLWQWLRQPQLNIPLWIGYGAQDRFADGMQRLVNRLPMAELVRVEGGHDWAAWMPLWASFLDAGHFKERA
jgi:pimeloyl-ACP methyl ester carboxylesterase